jgi:hypothetical protein
MSSTEKEMQNTGFETLWHISISLDRDECRRQTDTLADSPTGRISITTAVGLQDVFVSHTFCCNLIKINENEFIEHIVKDKNNTY